MRLTYTLARDILVAAGVRQGRPLSIQWHGRSLSLVASPDGRIIVSDGDGRPIGTLRPADGRGPRQGASTGPLAALSGKAGQRAVSPVQAARDRVAARRERDRAERDRRAAEGARLAQELGSLDDAEYAAWAEADDAVAFAPLYALLDDAAASREAVERRIVRQDSVQHANTRAMRSGRSPIAGLYARLHGCAVAVTGYCLLLAACAVGVWLIGHYLSALLAVLVLALLAVPCCLVACRALVLLCSERGIKASGDGGLYEARYKRGK